MSSVRKKGKEWQRRKGMKRGRMLYAYAFVWFLQRNTTCRPERETEREREIYCKELACAILGLTSLKVCKAGEQIGNSGKS